ncbi:outer membrane beta-barrel protein [Porifericola rhodea]|uniref:outer membrane beta-barrel protein n=1 Tax=Porifericola rhodea TaxID=930972 RepID=UPI0026656B9D|nr:outer membrane beta-barrel protein [Porifericola rhodea]WKN33819.1 outer membrane beta-barrel protein [Porifericola rhodea]
MKKKNSIFLALLLTVLAGPAWSQVELGLQLSPSLSFNRLDDDDASVDLSTDGVGGRIVAGLIGDIYIQENYYFSTGLFFVPKRVGIQDATNDIDEAYRLHYLQVPLSLKLFTNEVALDMRVYFQVGLTADIKILEDNLSDEVRYIEDFRAVDSNVLLSSGLEYRMGYSTTLYGGLSYRRGLVNVVKNQYEPNVGDIIIKNDLLSLDLGVKF